MPTLYSPEVAEMVKHGLFVKRVFRDVYNDGAIDKVADPVGPSFRVQGKVPVSPASHVVEEVLEARVNVRSGYPQRRKAKRSHKGVQG